MTGSASPGMFVVPPQHIERLNLSAKDDLTKPCGLIEENGSSSHAVEPLEVTDEAVFRECENRTWRSWAKRNFGDRQGARRHRSPLDERGQGEGNKIVRQGGALTSRKEVRTLRADLTDKPEFGKRAIERVFDSIRLRRLCRDVCVDET